MSCSSGRSNDSLFYKIGRAKLTDSFDREHPAEIAVIQYLEWSANHGTGYYGLDYEPLQADGVAQRVAHPQRDNRSLPGPLHDIPRQPAQWIGLFIEGADTVKCLPMQPLGHAVRGFQSDQ